MYNPDAKERVLEKIYNPDAKKKGDELLKFIYSLTNKAANEYCISFGNNSDTLIDNADFYKEHPVIFELNSNVKEDTMAFYQFSDEQQCIFFALPLEEHPTIVDLIKKDKKIFSNLIRLQTGVIDAAKNFLERPPLTDENCVIETEGLLRKGWKNEEEILSDLLEEYDNEFTDEFYRRAQNEIIEPKIKQRLKLYKRMNPRGGKTKSKKQKNNPKRRTPKARRTTNHRAMTRQRTSRKKRKNNFTRRPI